ncbi:unnamed protein product [Coregonus sp. 'balchen']|nr:unnamed protein product [Coregonus sp. 'balchen']
MWPDTPPQEYTHTEEPLTWNIAQQEVEAERGQGSPPFNEEHTDDFTAVGANESAYLGSVGANESAYLGGEEVTETEPWAMSGPAPPRSDQETHKTPHTPLEGDRTMWSNTPRETTTESGREKEGEGHVLRVGFRKRATTQGEKREQLSYKERYFLCQVQERLSIIQNRKSQKDLMGLRQTDRRRHLTHNLPQEDKRQQKMVVRQRLERSYVMQNPAGFKELLGPVELHSAETDNTPDSLRLATNAN